MASVFTVLTKLEADVSNFTAGMSQVESQLADIQKSVAKTGETSTKALQKSTSKAGMLFKGLAGVAVGAMTAAAAAVGAVLTKGVGRLIQIEEAEAKLLGLGNTAESVATIMENALSSVRGTAFGMGEAATVAAAAVAAGIQPGEQLARYLKTVADTAYIAGASMEEMGYVLNKATTAGKASNEVLSSLAGRGIPIYQMLGDAMGVTSDQIFDMASKGQISADMLQSALIEKIGGAALKSGDTVQGAFANMNASFQRVGANIAGPIFDQFQSFFKDVISAMNPFEAKAKEMGTVIGDALAPVMSSLIDIVMPLIDLVFALIAPLLNLVDAFKPLFDLVKPITDLFIKLVDIILPPLVHMVGAVSSVVAELIAIIIPLIDQALMALGSYIQGYLLPIFDALVALFRIAVLPVFQFLADIIGNYVMPIIAGFAAVWEDVLGPAIREFIDYVSPAMNQLSDQFGAVFDSIGQAVQWAYDNILVPVFGGIMDFFRDVLGIDVGFLTKVGDAFSKGFRKSQFAYNTAGMVAEESTEIWNVMEDAAGKAGGLAGMELGTSFAGTLGKNGAAGQKVRDAFAELMASFEEDVAKQQAKMRLGGMGLSTGLIEQILGDTDWEQIYDRIVKGGVKTAEAVQKAFNKTTAGIEELNAAFAKFTEKSTEFLSGVKKFFDGFKVLPAIEEDLGKFERQIADLANTARTQLTSALDLELITDKQQTDLNTLVKTHETAMRAIAKQRDDLDKQITDTLAIKEYGKEFNIAMKDVMAGIMPLRYATEVIGEFESAVMSGFQNVLASVNEAQQVGFMTQDLADSIRTAAATTNTQLRALARQRDGLAVEYAKFTAQLNAAKEFRQATSDAVKGYANITTVGKTARTMVKNLGKIVQRTEVFRQQLSTLNQMGLNKDLYNQILASGLDAGSATAKALLKGGPLAVEEMNSLFNQLDKTSKLLADDSTKVLFNGGEDVIQGFIDGVLAQDEDVRKQAEKIATAFNTQFQTTLNTATLNIDTLLTTLEAKRGELETTAKSLADSFNTAFQNALNAAVGANAPAAAPASSAYRAERGESIADVAAKFGTTEEALLAANPKFVDSANPNYKAGYKGGDYLYSNTLVNIPQAATGGLIKGMGSGTSDSIMARLSNGEFVMSAAAVNKYGTGFMSGLNSGTVTMPRPSKSNGGGGNNYSITVNAGVGDPAQIGKQVVNAIAAYEKTSGKKIIR